MPKRKYFDREKGILYHSTPSTMLSNFLYSGDWKSSSLSLCEGHVSNTVWFVVREKRRQEHVVDGPTLSMDLLYNMLRGTERNVCVRPDDVIQEKQ